MFRGSEPTDAEGGTTDPEGGGTDAEGGGTNPEGGGTTDPEGGGTTDPEGGGTTDPEGVGTTDAEGGTTDPEGVGTTDAEGGSTDSTLGSSVTACKKVLCSNGLLDSPQYWLRNQKVLVRLGQLEGDGAGSCTTICFVNLDQQRVDRHDDSCIKELASVSPDLPRLLHSLNVRQPKEKEILLLSGLEAPDTSHLDRSQSKQRGADVCLVQCAGAPRPPRSASSLVSEINKFLVGLQWGRDQQPPQGRTAGPRVDDDTNRSISSIEEDFLTASEHLGDDSEDDSLRNEPQCSDVRADAESSAETAAHRGRPTSQRGRTDERQDSEDSEVTLCTPTKRRGAPQRTGHHTEESAGHYATHLAESVLQDAFIHLSQDEPASSTEADPSLTDHPPAAPPPSQTQEPSARARVCSFELPKIIIVQSPDNCEGAPEWPETQTAHPVPKEQGGAARKIPDEHVKEARGFRNGGQTSRPLQVALACAANVVGTISSPLAAERLTTKPTEEDNKGQGHEQEDTDYSFSSAMCGMAQVAGAVAVVDLAEETGESRQSDDHTEIYTASVGLLSAAQASTAVTLHCSVAEGTSIEAFRANVAEVLHREAAEVLAQPQGYKSVADLLESTHKKIVAGITCPKKSQSVDEMEVEDFISEVADSLFKHAFEKAKKKKELEGPGKDVPNLQGFLQESVNSLLFNVLCLTSKKISDISKCNIRSFDKQEDGIRSGDYEAPIKEGMEQFNQVQLYIGSSQPDKKQTSSLHCTEKLLMFSGTREGKYRLEERESEPSGSHSSPHIKEECKHGQTRVSSKDCSDPQAQQAKGNVREPLTESSANTGSLPSTEKRGRAVGDSTPSSLTPQSSLTSSTGALTSTRMETDSRTTPVTCFADDLATTVVSMATELAAICLENSSGKQPWFCALKGAAGEAPPEGYLLPCRTTALRRKEGQNGGVVSKKHRPPRLSEIKRKTEEQPELMERLVNRVVDETVNPDDPQDPFALFASEVTARIMNCPELNVVDTSKPGQPRSRLQCERWIRGKAASYESIPEEDGDPSGTPNTLGPGSRLGQNLSRGSSISKQSSCESITDEFSKFMVNQMETEGRGFDLLLDYYAGMNASTILSAAVQQAATKKNGHLNVRRASSCLSKQSSTESITEEFYRFMLKDMDKENKDFRIARTKEWSNSLLPPSPRTPFCFRQSSVPDRRSSDSRLTVNSPIKANSFDGFTRTVRGDTLNIFPTNSVSASATGLCKSDSCLYQGGQTDRITDMLIHETWSSSIESLMRKNKIIVVPEDSIDLLDPAGDPQPHVQQYANRLAADIVETGKSVLGGGQHERGGGIFGQQQQHMPVGERRRGFKQSRPGCSRRRGSQEHPGGGDSTSVSTVTASPMRGPREVPLIHIEGDQKEEPSGNPERAERHPWDTPPEVSTQRCSSSERDRAAVAAVGEQTDRRSLSASSGESSTGSSEEGTGSWAHIAPDDDPPEETSSFIQLSEGNGTSSASSFGLADLEGFPDIPAQSTLISEETEKSYLRESRDNVDEGISLRSAGGSSSHRELLVVNFDLEPECESVDAELRVALQWIAASELGLAGVYFRKSKVKRTSRLGAAEIQFQRVLQLVSQKAWRIGDLFGAVVQFCKLLEEEEGGGSLSSLFDWLLETH